MFTLKFLQMHGARNFLSLPLQNFCMCALQFLQITTTMPHMKNSGILLIVGAALTWGTIGVAVALLYRVAHTDAPSVGFWRVAFSAPSLLLLSRWYVGPTFWRFERRDAPVLALMGLTFAAYQVCYFAAIPLIGVAAAVLINICSAPVIVAVLSSIFLKEQLTLTIGVALVGATFGALLLVGGAPQAATQMDLITGGLLALGAGFSYSLLALLSRSIAPRYHPVQPIAIAFTLSALLLLPVVWQRGLTLQYPPLGWSLLLYLGLVPTALGYSLYLRGMRTTPATISAIVALLEPLISTLCAVLFLGETLLWNGVVGGVLLVGSVAVLYWKQ